MMRSTLCILLFITITGCSSAPAAPPTLASLPTETQPPQPTATVELPTLPPTFTPTAPATEANLPTATAASTTIPTVTAVPTENPLGSPLDFPQNYPVNLTVQGGGYALSLAPPDAISYSLENDVYRFSIAHVGDEQETLTTQLLIRNGVIAGDYAPPICRGIGGGLPEGEPLCLSIVYTKDTLYAVNADGAGTLTIDTLEPLRMRGEIPLEDGILPGERGVRFNTAAYAVFRLEIAGQQRTEG